MYLTTEVKLPNEPPYLWHSLRSYAYLLNSAATCIVLAMSAIIRDQIFDMGNMFCACMPQKLKRLAHRTSSVVPSSNFGLSKPSGRAETK